jgi:hypothetical protein
MTRKEAGQNELDIFAFRDRLAALFLRMRLETNYSASGQRRVGPRTVLTYHV